MGRLGYVPARDAVGRLSHGPNRARRARPRRQGLRLRVTAEDRISLTEGVHAPARARAWVSEHTHALDLGDDVVQDALLVTSELVTNAVRHGAPDIELSLAVQPDRLRISVRDEGSSLPALPSQPWRAERASGRGLVIVAGTAADWGVNTADGAPGKTVWADIATG